VIASHHEKAEAMKKQKIKFADQRPLEMCIAQLRSVLQGLESGAIGISQGEHDVHLRPASAIDFELHAEQGKKRESLRLQLSWQRIDLNVAAPTAGKGPSSAKRSPATTSPAMTSTAKEPVKEPVKEAAAKEPITTGPPAGPDGPKSAPRHEHHHEHEAATSERPPPIPRPSIPTTPPPEDLPLDDLPLDRADARLAGTVDAAAAGIDDGWTLLDEDSVVVDDEAAPESVEPEPATLRQIPPDAAAQYQQIYATSRTLDAEGRWHLDQQRLAESLAHAGVDPLTQQDLYNLALQADADGRASLFKDDAALPKAS